jgi:hypothetical protein
MTHTKDTALDLALEALVRIKRFGNTFGYRSWEQNPYEQVCEAITAIKQALAAPTVQEPVAYRSRLASGNYTYCTTPQFFDNAQPLYTTPPAQPAPVQEPFGYLEIEDIESHSEYPHNCRSINLWHEGGEEMVAIYTTPPAAPVPLTPHQVCEMGLKHDMTNLERRLYELGVSDTEARHGITKGQT